MILNFIKQPAKPHYCTILFLALFTLSLLFTGCEGEEYVEAEIEQEKPEETERGKTEEKDGKKDEENKPGNTDAADRRVFAQGVTVEHGWHDVDKLKKPQDIMACWLITASNMLQWWQDRYTESGNELPEGTPNGIGKGPYKSAIFDDAITKFMAPERGGNITTGLIWYIEGENAALANHSYPMPGTGGYLKNMQGEPVEYSKKYILSYDDWENMATEEEALQIFSENLLNRLKTGAAMGLEIKTHVGLGGVLHAITLWGAEVNSKNEVTSVYITDSDDYEHQLVRCPIETYDFKSELYNAKQIAMKIPAGEAYEEGGTWAILRVFHIAPPKSVRF
ncbi:IdeS/Mac family cysteine endopeptidase [Bacteroides pyogenes]|uniref:IdeS/Mac family cysteine endopeptidase n=1 Tax=Bacteroides pyogenes TaxID=310300 RepID=UPI001EEA40CF|nr:IdeS/Mac family cysteine endopeptidase [Bacteroides pyogenes]MCE9107122.1 IdeS/Mac family cysteine endopeptidase [Bacteroides pyogenes]